MKHTSWMLLLLFSFTSVAGAAAGDGTIELWIASVGAGPEPETNAITPTKEVTIGVSNWVDLKVIYHAGVDEGNLFGAKFDVTIEGPASFGPLDAIQHSEAFTFQDAQFDPREMGCVDHSRGRIDDPHD